MSVHSKVFSYDVDGLSYTVTVYEEDGEFRADINVLEGSMDVNAVYFGDDEMSGKSAGLKGPQNMNGARHDGEKVQWDDAVDLSKPGLGPEGDDKDTYLSTGDTLTISLDVDSLDQIDIFGVRATSTSTKEGSIKGVSSDPEEPEVPEEPETPDEPTFDKIFFDAATDDNPADTYIRAEDSENDDWEIPTLPEGTEPTFENFLEHYESDEVGGDVTQLESITFFETDDEGDVTELFTIDAPEGGFEDADAVLQAYDDALDEMEAADNEIAAPVETVADPELDPVEDTLGSTEAPLGDDALALLNTLTLTDAMQMGADAELVDSTDMAEDVFAGL